MLRQRNICENHLPLDRRLHRMPSWSMKNERPGHPALLLQPREAKNTQVAETLELYQIRHVRDLQFAIIAMRRVRQLLRRSFLVDVQSRSQTSQHLRCVWIVRSSQLHASTMNSKSNQVVVGNLVFPMQVEVGNTSQQKTACHSRVPRTQKVANHHLLDLLLLAYKSDTPAYKCHQRQAVVRGRL